MNILLINTNPVVSRLVSLCVREDDIVLEEVTDMDAVIGEVYDILFLDDLSYVEDVKHRLPALKIEKKIFLSSKQSEDIELEDFNEVIKKPFLPSQITAVIEAFKADENTNENMEEKTVENEVEAEESFIFPLSTEEKSIEEILSLDGDVPEETHEETESLLDSVAKSSNVLDVNEIDKIKALLDENEKEESVDTDEDYETRKVKVITEQLVSDGLEIVSEDEIVDILSQKSKKKKSKKEKNKKEKKRANKEKEETYTFEEALLAAIEGMKIKKIRKLLKHADINITIRFKDEK
jgi:hypothetical protein